MIKIKPGVQFHHISFLMPEVMRIIYMVQKMAPEGYEVTITSACDGVHRVNSSHYRGKAFDFRVKDFPTDNVLTVWQERIQQALGTCYFVLLEKTHLHIQLNS